MAKINRFNFEREYGNGQGTIPWQGTPSPNGKWVTYADAKKLEEKAYKSGYTSGYQRAIVNY